VNPVDDFRPAGWLRNRHVQTIAASLSPWPLAMPAQDRLVFALGSDSALIARAWWHPGRRRTLLLLHGVGGSAESGYMLRSAIAFHRAGCNVVRLNLRGAGEGVSHARSIYHAGLTSDVDHVVRELVRDTRVAELCIVGFSLGGSIALKLAGEWRDAPPHGVVGLTTVSAPTDFHAVSDELERVATFPYRRFIVRGVVRQALAFAHHHPTLADFDRAALLRARTIREYDAVVMVPMHGFDSVRHYYDTTTSAPWLPTITVPTLLIHADDDPIIPAASVRASLPSASPAVRTAWTSHGGHVGWFAGIRTSDRLNTWAVRRVLGFFGT